MSKDRIYWQMCVRWEERQMFIEHAHTCVKLTMGEFKVFL